MNETLQTMAKRFACRKYDGRPLDRQTLDAIALAALQSPSGLNRQPWEIHIITDREFLAELDSEGMRMLSEAEDKSTYKRFMDRGGSLLYNTPCMFLVLKRPGYDMDAGIVAMSITLAAQSMGLGSVVCGMAEIPFTGPKGDDFKKRAAFHDDFEFGISVLVGHAAMDGEAHEPDSSKLKFI